MGLAVVLEHAGRCRCSAAAPLLKPDPLRHQSGHAACAATKAAVDSLTRIAAVGLVPHGIRVNSLSRGMMETPLQAQTEAAFAGLAGRNDLAAFKAERTARIPLGLWRLSAGDLVRAGRRRQTAPGTRAFLPIFGPWSPPRGSGTV